MPSNIKEKKGQKIRVSCAWNIFKYLSANIANACCTDKQAIGKSSELWFIIFFFSFTDTTLCINHSNDKVQKILEGKIYQSSLREEVGATRLSDRKFIGLIFLWEMEKVKICFF